MLNKKVLWVLVAVMAVSVVVNVFLVVTNFQAQNQFTDLNSTYEALVIERDALNREIAGLVYEKDALNLDLASVTTERDSLKSEVALLVTERDQARADVETCSGVNNITIAENEALKYERDSLKAEIGALIIERDEAVAEVSNLLSELNSLREPNIKTIDMQSYDARQYTPDRLFVSGLLVNVGGGCAYNLTLKVVAYDVLGTLVINTTAYETYWLNPASYLHVDTYVNYEGQPLSEWTITAVWDTK